MTMRIAIIGEPGTGKSTLAPVLAFRLGETPVDSLADALEHPSGPLVLDGVPDTTEELETLRAAGVTIDRVLHLQADFALRAGRISRRVSVGVSASDERARLLSAPAAELVADRWAGSVPVLGIDANRTRSEVLAAALDALGLPPP